MKKVIILFSVLLAFYFFSFAQQIELIFSHKYHAEEVGATCTDCHKAAESQQATDNLLPDMQGCYTCHDAETECTVCHKNPEQAIVYPRITTYVAKFSHQQHLMKSDSCLACHGGVNLSENVLDKHLPTMKECMACHPLTSQTDYCYSCHNQTDLLKPADHHLTWKKDHGIVASDQKSECATCHQDQSCLDCHRNENLDHRIHPLNYVNKHGIFAKGNKENCYTCHEELSFCVDCHRQRMVMPRTHAAANWSNKTTGGGHARAAKLDLDSCISCHSDAMGDPVCVQCHHN